MKRLIVNADDFGMSAPINMGIVEAHRRGIVTSTTLMANGDYFDHAVELLRENPKLKVGIHINLVEGKPLCPSEEVSSITNKKGHFFGNTLSLFFRSLIGQIKVKEVKKEMRAQIEKVLEVGINPTHLDSHMHVHSIPLFKKAIIEVANEYSISTLRIPIEHSLRDITHLKNNKIKSWLISTLTKTKSNLNTQVNSSEYFIGPKYMGSLDEQTLTKILNNLPDGVTELMCHPSLNDKNDCHLRRRNEFNALTSFSVMQAIEKNHISLCHYGGA